MDRREAAHIAQSAAAAKTVFAVNYNVRFYPAVLQLRRSVSQGELGEVVL